MLNIVVKIQQCLFADEAVSGACLSYGSRPWHFGPCGSVAQSQSRGWLLQYPTYYFQFYVFVSFGFAITTVNIWFVTLHHEAGVKRGFHRVAERLTRVSTVLRNRQQKWEYRYC